DKISESGNPVSGRIKGVVDKMVSLGTTDKQRSAIKDFLIYNIVQGARVVGAETAGEQKKYVEMFKASRTGLIKDESLRKDIETLHPMLFYLTGHGDVDGFFANEGVDQSSDVGQVFSLFYAPMLYAHDAEEEASGEEGFKVLHGKEMTKGDIIGDEYLSQLIDVFDKNVAGVSDKNSRAHLKQMQMVYHSFEPVLSSALKKRYGESMSKFEKYVNEKSEDVESSGGTPRRGLENMLSILAIVSIVSFLSINFSISGNAILSDFSKRGSVWSFVTLVVGISSLGILIWYKSKARRFRRAFFR
ncbi:MAG: hypothetical protein KAS32_23055, partial [Candidatus Peribacteraceae bacterium]|nr:hypothetical protein [Candidatus Peribacteraceae bacterium]